VVVRERALAHQAVRDGNREMRGEVAQLVGGVGEQHPAAGVDHRARCAGERFHHARGGLVVDRRLVQRLGVMREALKQRRIDRLGEDVHRHRHQHRPGPAAPRELERLVDDLGEEIRPLDAPRAFHERAVDLVLRRIGVQVHFLVRMLAVVVARHVTRDHHHRDRVERSVRHAGRGVGEPGPEMAQHHGGLPLRARVAVGHVRRDLLVARVDELDGALRELGEHRDIGVAAQPEHVLDAALLEVLHQLVRDEVAGRCVSHVLEIARLVHRDSPSLRWRRLGAGGRCRRCCSRSRAIFPPCARRAAAAAPTPTDRRPTS